MNYIEALLSEKLKSKNPLLDILGSDRRVLQTACKDLVNYLKVHWNLIGKKANECDLVERLEEFYNDNPGELQDFVDLWVGFWLKKWKERVKLLVGQGKARRWNKVSKMLREAEPTWKALRNTTEMQELVVSKLVRNGEICGTSILAENLLKMELGRSKKIRVSDEELALRVVNNTLRRAGEISRSKGPLIFVKVDKAYYNAS